MAVTKFQEQEQAATENGWEMITDKMTSLNVDDDCSSTDGTSSTTSESLLSASSSVLSASAPAKTTATIPTSVWAAKTSPMSFRDIILKNNNKNKNETPEPQQRQFQQKKFKAAFVVVATPTKKVQKKEEQQQQGYEMDEEDCYYGRKAHGAISRRNGRKTRPDEAKRLQMTMAKKRQQRQRQQCQ